MRYEFYLNTAKDVNGIPVGFFGYRDGHELVLAYKGDTVDGTQLDVCEDLFSKFNINHPEDYRNRSMSVGDVVVLSDKQGTYAYAVAFALG